MTLRFDAETALASHAAPVGHLQTAYPGLWTSYFASWARGMELGLPARGAVLLKGRCRIDVVVAERRRDVLFGDKSATHIQAAE